MSETYTTAEVGKHKDEANGFWLIVENDVYDVTSTTTEPKLAEQMEADKHPQNSSTNIPVVLRS